MGRQLSLEVYYTYMTVMILIMSRVTEMCLWRKKIHNTEKKRVLVPGSSCSALQGQTKPTASRCLISLLQAHQRTWFHGAFQPPNTSDIHGLLKMQLEEIRQRGGSLGAF